MKPSWKDAPDWANWLAMDSVGTWFWYESRPVKLMYSWATSGIGRFEYAPTSADLGDFLEGRP